MSKIIKPNSGIIKPKLTQEQFGVEFKNKMNEIREWAKNNGYEINSFLRITPDAISTDIGYRPIKK